MEATVRAARYAVFDDVLSPAALARVWAFACRDAYTFDLAQRNAGAFEGQLLRGTTVLSAPLRSAPLTHQTVYPTGRGIDELLAAILNARDDLTAWWGQQGSDWALFSACAYMYPEQSSRSWHTDGPTKRGSFTFFAHPEWNPGWGGELCVAADAAHDFPEHVSAGSSGSVVEQSERAARAMMDTGVGTFIVPKPGRLVVMAPETIHRVNRVYATAGGRMRAAIVGFALPPT